jgi:hypothetical protein
MRDVAGAVGGEQREANVCGVIIALNENHLRADDRWHFVAWSDASLSDFGALPLVSGTFIPFRRP